MVDMRAQFLSRCSAGASPWLRALMSSDPLPPMEPEEITIQLVEIRSGLADVKTDVAEIKTQTLLTNGNVRRHDIVLARLQGAVALGVFVIPIAAAVIATIV